jgi:hypothetical protein
MAPSPRRLCVYTALIGSYEHLNEQPIAAQTNIPFFCFTDDPNLRSDTWTIVPIVPEFGMDPIRSQRLLKLRPWDVLPDYDCSLYIDNSVKLLATPDDVFARHASEMGLTAPAHSSRQSVLDEFLEVARLGLDDQTRIFEQLNHYQLEYPDILRERPFWAAILIREHGSPQVRRMAEIWGAHILRYSRRDQLSLNVAVRQSGLTPKILEIDNATSWLHTWPHSLGRNRNGRPGRSAPIFDMPIAIARRNGYGAAGEGEARASEIIAHVSERYAASQRSKLERGLLGFKRRGAPTSLPKAVSRAAFNAVRGSVFFDAQFYLAANPAVKAAGTDPALDYLLDGGAKGRDPGPYFSTQGYLHQHSDVAAAGMNALAHYELFGRREGRSLRAALRLGGQ